jgi:hypothetical protein
MKRQTQQPSNLLDLKPSRNLEWEDRDNDLVTLIVPKFKRPLFVKYVVPLLAKRVIKVKLDAYGSFVWRKCDGSTPVSTISEEMATKFGTPTEEMYERVGKFVRTLERDKFVVLHGKNVATF